MNVVRIAKLQSGEEITYSEPGNSMVPIIYSRQPVTVMPYQKLKRNLVPGDIVYAKVKGKCYTHLVKATRVGQVLISNNRGHENGWTSLDKVYGVVIAIDGSAYKPKKSQKNESPQGKKKATSSR